MFSVIASTWIWWMYVLLIEVDAFSKGSVILGSACGRTFTSSSGNFTYPDSFPFQPYLPGLRCRWRIRMPDQNSKIVVTLPYSIMRVTDYLVIMDGSVGPLPLKPCNSVFYNDISMLFNQGLLPNDRILAIRGSRTALRGSRVGLAVRGVVFTSLSDQVVIEFCPNRFPFRSFLNFGISVKWHEVPFQSNRSSTESSWEIPARENPLFDL